MAKKLVTIDVNNKELTVSAKSSKANEVKNTEASEMEKLGFVELNSSAASKSVKNSATKGFEKNLSEEKKRNVKAKTSEVEDYFDFSFRKNEDLKEKTAEITATKKATRKTTSKTCKKTETNAIDLENKAEESVSVKIDECLKQEQTENISSVMFDNEAYQIIRVARIGSLFDCEKRAIQA